MTDHRSYHTDANEKGIMAVCSCGWKSSRYSAGGIAGAVWDAHKADAEAHEED